MCHVQFNLIIQYQHQFDNQHDWLSGCHSASCETNPFT